MRERPTVRVLLIRPDNRLLLIRYEDPRVLPKFRHFWATVGGAVEPEESADCGAAGRGGSAAGAGFRGRLGAGRLGPG